ncbi:MAG: response regulator [Lachnospiraceae bacterium]|nr:response regulator [Candidatus Colinaster scatohippi]
MKHIFKQYFDKNEYIEMTENMPYIDSKVSVFASFGAMAIALASFVTLCIVSPFSVINVIVGICVLNTVFANFFAEKYYGNKGKRIAYIYCVIFLMLSLPYIWFTTGGYSGPGGVWLIFTAVYCIFAINGRIQRYILYLLAFETVFIITANIVHPEFVAEYEGVSKYLVQIVSLLGVGAYIQHIQIYQLMEFSRDKLKLQKLQEETEQQYEETVSVNEDLLSTTNRLEQAIKTQRSFTASMNHELRAPLNGIEGCLQILLMDESLSDESRETIVNAITASKTINQTVNDMLDFAMLEEGRFEKVMQPFDLRDILDNLSTIFKPQANAKNLKFRINIQKDTRVSIVGDGVRIQQIMTNLISNGIKYTHSGGVVMTVSTERGLLKFDVEDTGQGMSKESVNAIFEPFTRFNRSENVNIQGSGLGMNIVSNLIKEMDGVIYVNSDIGIGTVFHVEIPIIFYDSDITYMSPRKTENIKAKEVNLAGCRILFVDDTEINGTVFKGLLKKAEAEIYLADSGRKAIKLCSEQDFDIIFMDHQMPELDGVETVKYIKEMDNGKYSGIPVVMCTGNAGQEYKTLYSNIGAAGYLLKPFMYEDLIECFNYIQ